MLPDSLTLWFNADHRLRRYSDDQTQPTGIRYDSSDSIAYPSSSSSFPEDLTTLPVRFRNYPIVPDVEVPAVPAKLSVKPVWLTMRVAEKQAVAQTIAAFVQAWHNHDTIALEALVDTKWLLEITRPDKRAKLSSEDVWQQLWRERLRRQPQWKHFVLMPVFAFEVPPRLLDEVPMSVNKWNLDRTLPGLNVLVWLDAQRADGEEYKMGARLYLVKRRDGWKVFQFGSLYSGNNFTHTGYTP